jgi:hypothetical protein
MLHRFEINLPQVIVIRWMQGPQGMRFGFGLLAGLHLCIHVRFTHVTARSQCAEIVHRFPRDWHWIAMARVAGMLYVQRVD